MYEFRRDNLLDIAKKHADGGCMITNTSIGFIGLLAAAIASPASSEAQAPPVATAHPPKERLICEKDLPLGSRLGARQVCLTPEAWAQRRLQERQGVERGQAAPCMPTTTDSHGRRSC